MTWTLRLWWQRPVRRSVLVLLVLAGCSATPPTVPFGVDASPTADASALLRAIAVAADVRRAADIPIDAQRSREPVVRRARTRALARILDDDADPLFRALDDDDDEVVAWAAYGLGESCKGHEQGASALAARLETLGDSAVLKSPAVLLRAIGRCATDVSESALRPWLRAGPPVAEAASFALGEVAARRGALSTETVVALLDAATGSTPLAAALYPFARSDLTLEPAQTTRLKAAARAELNRPGPLRLLAVRVLGRVSDFRSSQDLAILLESGDALGSERIEAAHALGRLKDTGQAALAEAVGLLGHLRPNELESTGRVNLLLSVLESLSASGVVLAAVPLWDLARLEPGPGARLPAVRRVSRLRCAAASKLARGAWDSEVLQRCDLGDGETGERARLDALAMEDVPLGRARRGALSDLARSGHPRVREAALDLVARHPEMADVGRWLLAQALSSNEPGVVAKAASLVQAHAERVFVGPPAQELDSGVAAALREALAHPWPPDMLETRGALVEAALATGVSGGRSYAEAACRDDNATLRARAAKALSSTGDVATRCPPPHDRGLPAREIGREMTAAVRIALDTDAGPLALVLDPVGAPIAVTRLTALARAGFYSGTSFHRVVPGYLAQFGDPRGDGYGGSGELLRCETSPIPFARGDVGVALAGRDTGSSQVFVTLARYPSLDGEYAWVGHAEGDWDAVVEGDIIRTVRVEPP